MVVVGHSLDEPTRRRTEDDLGGAVMPRRHDRRVIVALERRTAKIDELDARVVEDLAVAVSLRKGREHRAVSGEPSRRRRGGKDALGSAQWSPVFARGGCFRA